MNINNEMSASKKYKDVPGFTRDPETGRYIPKNLDVEEFLNLGSTRKSPRKVAKIGQNFTQKKDTNNKASESSSNKQIQRKVIPGFIQDPETGKYKPVPFDLKEINSMFSNNKNPPANDHNDNPQPNKFRKTDHGVRKELFTKPLPATRPSLRPSSHFGMKKKSVIPSIVVSKSSQNELAVPLPPTPLLNPSQTSKIFHKLATETETKSKTDKIQATILEKIENLFKMCQEIQQVQQQQGEDIKKILTIVTTGNKNDSRIIDKLDKERTPLKQKLSSFHPKLYKTKYSASKKPAVNITSIREEESPTVNLKTPDSHRSTDEFVKMEQLCLTPKNASVTPISTVCNLFKTMDVDEVKSPKRRSSLRLKGKIIDNQISPVVMKSADLRKTTLTRSLVKKCQIDSPKSPRTQKAFDMYVSTKKNCDYLLLTPSFAKNQLQNDSGGGNSARKRISQNVRQQCLLLQDTPT